MMRSGKTQRFKHRSCAFTGTDEDLGTRYSIGISEKNMKFCKCNNIIVQFILKRKQKEKSSKYDSVIQN